MASELEMQEAEDAIDHLRGRLEALEAENARLRKVLEPFARLADAVFRDGMNINRRDDVDVWGFDAATLTYGDLRAARRVREGGKVE